MIYKEMDKELIDFFKNELNNDESSLKEETYCLISHEIKDKTYIKLECGHGFNYKNIYNEVLNQKCYMNIKSLNDMKLSINQLKCPYCRNIQNTILPPIDGFELLNGVNTPYKYVMLQNNCKYVFKRGIKKNLECNIKCHDIYCKKHAKIMNNKIIK